MNIPVSGFKSVKAGMDENTCKALKAVRASFQEAYSIKVTDFGIAPPTEVMGTITCRDDIKFVLICVRYR